MEKTLLILEVSRKQEYIFSAEELKENARRSAVIHYVTSSDFFSEAAGDRYREADNLVYSGGGHTVLQFDTAEAAKAFAAAVTEQVMRKFDGLEMFAAQMPFDEGRTAGENLKELSKCLEQKKSRRQAAFRQLSFGVEARKLGGHNDPEIKRNSVLTEAPDGCKYADNMGQLADIGRKENNKRRRDSFVAVVHIDGNSMGHRVDRIYAKETEWGACCKALRAFSEDVQNDFECAFQEMIEELLLSEQHSAFVPVLPVRPVILAGDDVCFVTTGSFGTECARIFLEKLAAKTNRQDGIPYSACAGIALVHTKYPFFAAYELAEELCSNAKRFGAALDEENRISAMDWHIEFGQLKDGLPNIRRDYETEDGNRMEMRPLTVVDPAGCQGDSLRTYEFFAQLCMAMQGERGKTARGKIKDLREAFKQGELESEFFLRQQAIEDLLKHPMEIVFRGAKDQRQAALDILSANSQSKAVQQAFLPFEEDRREGEIPFKRCLFFDAIELIDHCEFVKGMES